MLKRPFAQHPMGVTPDGAVVYLERHPATGSDLWVLSPDGRTTPLVVTPYNETAAAVSADGKYVAYTSDESGRGEVYVIPLSGKRDRVTVSIDGGTRPVWSRDGRELFYRAGDDLMSAQVQSIGPAGVPRSEEADRRVAVRARVLSRLRRLGRRSAIPLHPRRARLAPDTPRRDPQLVAGTGKDRREVMTVDIQVPGRNVQSLAHPLSLPALA